MEVSFLTMLGVVNQIHWFYQLVLFSSIPSFTRSHKFWIYIVHVYSMVKWFIPRPMRFPASDDLIIIYSILLADTIESQART